MMKTNISILLGQTLSSIKKFTDKYAHDAIEFKTTSGETYKLYHEQECCEDVHIEEIHGGAYAQGHSQH